MSYQTVIVLDFGGQYKELIARRVRECGVYSVILPGDTPLERIQALNPIGVILTGGGSNMRNIEKAFRNHTHIEKIRTAKFVTQTIVSSHEAVKARDGMMNTVLGLLAKGDINCAGGPIDLNGDLFKGQKTNATPAEQRPARQATDTPAGVVRTEAEKQKAEAERQRAEEEKRRQQEEEERARRDEELRRKEEEERIRRENSPWNKLKKGIMKFTKQIVEEE